MSTLSGSVRQALKWSYAMTWGEQLLTTVVTFVLAALLGPGAFGLMAMALAYVLFSQTVLEQGFVVAVIQREKLEPCHLNAVFWIVMSASLVQVGLSIGLSEWWARIINVPELPALIAALSLTIPIRALTVVQKALLQRALDFKSLALRTNVSVLLGGCVGVAMAFTGYGVWALVMQRLMTDLIGLIVLWSVSPWRPRFEVSLQACRDLFGFSIANVAASMGVFVQHHADAFLMGAFFGPASVGIYRLSLRLVSTVVQLTTAPLRAVSLAQFSRLQGDPVALNRAVLTSLRLSLLGTLPILAVLGISAHSVTALMGADWRPAGDVVRILCLFGAAMAFAYFSAPILQATGRPQLLAASMWSHGLLWSGSLALLGTLLREASMSNQVLSVASARVGVAAVLSLPILVLILRRLCGVTLRQLAGAAATPIYTVLAIIVISYLVTRTGVFDSVNAGLLLICQAVVALAVGVATILATDTALRQSFAALIVRIRARPAKALFP